jgi:VIT1/CCC1 family predicted Fe2+/Mn2+ transporter
MKQSIKKGFSFGLTSGIITTLGLIVGLHSSTNSKLVIIGGILIIAVADALSDALGMHISEESGNGNSHDEVWEATIATFLTKLIFALTFVVPVLFLKLGAAIIVSIVWGLSFIALISYYIGKDQKIKSHNVILEHLTIAVIVIIITHYVGDWIATFG